MNNEDVFSGPGLDPEIKNALLLWEPLTKLFQNYGIVESLQPHPEKRPDADFRPVDDGSAVGSR